MEEYSYGISIKKGIKYSLIYAFGIFLAGLFAIKPEWMQLTIGGIITFLYDWIKNKWNVNLP